MLRTVDECDLCVRKLNAAEENHGSAKQKKERMWALIIRKMTYSTRTLCLVHASFLLEPFYKNKCDLVFFALFLCCRGCLVECWLGLLPIKMAKDIYKFAKLVQVKILHSNAMNSFKAACCSRVCNTLSNQRKKASNHSPTSSPSSFVFDYCFQVGNY